MLNAQISWPIALIQTICEQYPIRKLSVFGSVLRDDFTDKSDIDVLVEFEPGSGMTYFDLFNIKEALSDIFKRDVDLLTPAALSPYFHDDVIEQAVTLYECG